MLLGGNSCSACWAGRYCPKEGSTTNGILCDAGTFSAAAAERCTDCSAGRFSAKGQGECKLCMASHFGTDTGATNSGCDGRCAPGQYSTNDRLACKDCPAGRFSKYGSASKLCDGVCRTGRFSGVGSKTCTTCEAGRASRLFRATACTDCKRGRFSAEGQRACSLCPRGKYNVGQGSTRCWDCAPGRYSAPNNNCVPCAAGRYGEGGSPTEECSGACLAGRYSAPGFASCIVCNAGKWSLHESVKCNLCAAGRYGMGADVSAKCTGPCAAGRFSPIDGAPNCKMCPAGRYSVEGATSCSACASGHFATAVGSRSAGCAGACPRGQFSSDDGTECLPCMAGYFGGNIPTSDPQCEGKCAAGRFSETGAAECKACPSGRAQHKAASTSCAFCAEGQFAPLQGQNRCLACRKGQWSIVGATNCQSLGHLGELVPTATRSPMPVVSSTATPVPTPRGPCTAVALVAADRPLMLCSGVYVQLDPSEFVFTYKGTNRCGSGSVYMYYARTLHRWVVGTSTSHGPYLLASEVGAFQPNYIPTKWSVSKQMHIFHIDPGISARCTKPPKTPAPTPAPPTHTPTPFPTSPHVLLRFRAHIYDVPGGKFTPAMSEALRKAISSAASTTVDKVTIGDAKSAPAPPTNIYLKLTPKSGVFVNFSLLVDVGAIGDNDVLDPAFAEWVVTQLRNHHVDIASITVRKEPHSYHKAHRTMAQMLAQTERQVLEQQVKTARAWEHATDVPGSAPKMPAAHEAVEHHALLVMGSAIVVAGMVLFATRCRVAKAAPAAVSNTSAEELTQLAASLQLQWSTSQLDCDVEDI